MFEEDNALTLHAAVLCEEEESTPAAPFRVRVWAGREVKKVELLPDETPVPFVNEEGWAAFDTRETNIFDMYRILF